MKLFIKQNSKYKIEGDLIYMDSSLCNPKTDVSKTKIRLARKYLRFLKKIPWIRFAGISGSVSYLTAATDDDIDIFMVVKKNRLWITRGVVRVILTLTGRRRRYGKKDFKDKFCTNFYIEENIDILKLFNSKNKKVNEFLLGLELAVLKPVINKDYYFEILRNNDWIFSYFPGLQNFEKKSYSQNRVFFFSIIVDVLNQVAMKLQVLYMKILKHPYNPERISKEYALFFDQEGWRRREELIKKHL